MRTWVVRNGDWYLMESPSWWSLDSRDAARFEQAEAEKIAQEARKYGCRPFGEPASGAKAQEDVKR